MRPQLFLFVPVLLLALSFSAPVSCLASPKKACVTQDGSVVLRRKCRAAKGLTPLSLGLISGSIDVASGEPGPQGPAGPQGEQGIPGEVGPAGLSGWEAVTNNSTRQGFPNRSTFSVSVECPTGKVVTGGSCSTTSTVVSLSSSVAAGVNAIAGWRCTWVNATGINAVSLNAYTVRAFCIDA